MNLAISNEARKKREESELEIQNEAYKLGYNLVLFEILMGDLVRLAAVAIGCGGILLATKEVTRRSECARPTTTNRKRRNIHRTK